MTKLRRFVTGHSSNRDAFRFGFAFPSTRSESTVSHTGRCVCDGPKRPVCLLQLVLCGGMRLEMNKPTSVRKTRRTPVPGSMQRTQIPVSSAGPAQPDRFRITVVVAITAKASAASVSNSLAETRFRRADLVSQTAIATRGNANPRAIKPSMQDQLDRRKPLDHH